MNNLLNLDEYKDNIQITLNGKQITIPPVTLHLRNQIIRLLSNENLDNEKVLDLDSQLLILFLNSNLDNYIFTESDILSLNTQQVKELVSFITHQLTSIEKN